MYRETIEIDGLVIDIDVNDITSEEEPLGSGHITWEVEYIVTNVMKKDKPMNPLLLSYKTVDKMENEIIRKYKTFKEDCL